MGATESDKIKMALFIGLNNSRYAKLISFAVTELEMGEYGISIHPIDNEGFRRIGLIVKSNEANDLQKIADVFLGWCGYICEK